MKRRLAEGRSAGEGVLLMFVLSLAVLLFIAAATTARAATPSRDEKKLNQELSALDKTSDTSKGATVVVTRLEKEFSVPESTITGLRDRKLGYGEIAIVLALAKSEPGGITDTNISAIMTMRMGPPVMGWGEIADKLGVRLGTIVSDVHKVDTGSRRDLAGAGPGMEHGGSAGGGMRDEWRDNSTGMGHQGGHGRY